MKKASSLIIILTLICFCSWAQTFNKAKLDSLFELIEAKDRGMGSITIHQNGDQVYHKTFGFAEVASEEVPDENTKYRIGSISKTFTATIIMQLVEEGKLTLSTTVEDYFPKIENSDKITIEHFLRHRSGLYNFTNDPKYLKWNEDPQEKEELIARFVKNGAVFQPGEKAEYSNTNYVLLSFIAEKLEEKTFGEILDQRIIKPLDLQNTYYGGKINRDRNEVFSYKQKRGWEKQPETDMSLPVGAGAIVSTPSDLNVFYRSLLNGELVNENSLDQMTTLIEGFGIGMFRIPFYDKSSFGHSGGIDGFQSMASYFPEDDMAIAVCFNGLSMDMNEIMIGALSIYFNKNYQLPAISKIITLKPKELDMYTGTYSSPSFPLKVTIKNDGTFLVGQATGQPPFILDALGDNRFEFRPSGLILEFTPAQNTMLLKQGGGVFELKRE